MLAFRVAFDTGPKGLKEGGSERGKLFFARKGKSRGSDDNATHGRASNRTFRDAPHCGDPVNGRILIDAALLQRRR